MKVWDFATRVYHWLQAIVFMLLIATGFSGNGPHVTIGLALFTLIVWRVMLGFFGSETNRFSQFVRSPISTIKYLTRKHTQEKSTVGHNPLGGWMVVILIVGLLCQSLSGLVLAGLLDGLPLSQYWLTDSLFEIFESVHFVLARALPMLVICHVSAVVIYKLRKKPLLKAMFTGYQASATGATTPMFIPQTHAFLMLVAAGLVTIAIIALPMV